MTAHSLRAEYSACTGSACTGTGWYWLRPVVETAALATGNWPPSPSPGALGWTSLPRVATRTPAPDVRSVSSARHFVAATLRAWHATDRDTDIVTVASELLTNALRHALPTAVSTSPRPLRLGMLDLGPCVLCAVADPSALVPVPRDADSLGETGRGLHVIEALSDGWGYTPPTPLGKAVWAIFSLPAVQPVNAPDSSTPGLVGTAWAAYG